MTRTTKTANKTQNLSIACREEGRGTPSIERFASLLKAKQYIEARWQGPEYMDGKESFHTDYCTYELRGFTLNDIGTTGWHPEGWPTFTFKLDGILTGNTSDRARIVCQADEEGETYHFRATEAYIAQADAKCALIGVWTDAEYLAKFGKDYVPYDTHDVVAETVTESHAKHENPDGHTWCPLCQKIVLARPQVEDNVPF